MEMNDQHQPDDKKSASSKREEPRWQALDCREAGLALGIPTLCLVTCDGAKREKAVEPMEEKEVVGTRESGLPCKHETQQLGRGGRKRMKTEGGCWCWAYCGSRTSAKYCNLNPTNGFRQIEVSVRTPYIDWFSLRKAERLCFSTTEQE